MHNISNNNVIFAPITAMGGAIVVVRISGSSLAGVLKLFKMPNFKHRVATLVDVIDVENNSILDSALVTFFESPNSFTGEDVLEVCLHAGLYIVTRFLLLLEKECGCRMAKNGEFSERAFLNGKVDLIQAEGILSVIHAQTAEQHKIGMQLYSGKVSRLYDEWRNTLLNILTLLEITIDFSEEDIPDVMMNDIAKQITTLAQEMESHLKNFNSCKQVVDGFNICIIGEPNVGKSSLINAITGNDVAIVSNIAGTTRDLITATVNIGGFLVKFVDTAGIRSLTLTNDLIEQEGIRRTVNHAENSFLNIVLLDARNPYNEQLERLNYTPKANDIIVINKIDLLSKTPDASDVVKLISAKTGNGIGELMEEINKRLQFAGSSFVPAITNGRHQLAIQKSVDCINDVLRDIGSAPVEIIAEELMRSANLIAEVVGVINSTNVLDNIFGKFCIGK